MGYVKQKLNICNGLANRALALIWTSHTATNFYYQLRRIQLVVIYFAKLAGEVLIVAAAMQIKLH